jgi:hypothetical protein
LRYPTQARIIAGDLGGMIMKHIRLTLAAFAMAVAAVPGVAQAQTQIDNRLAAIARLERVNAAFTSASMIVLGRMPQKNDIEIYLMLMVSPEYGMSDKVTDEVKFIDAVNFLKVAIAKPQGAALRAEAIDNTFREVYGRPSSPVEQATWDSQVKGGKAWFAPMVTKERAKLNANPAERQETILRVYQFAEGRMPTQGDRDFWGKKTEDYADMVAAERKWLYTPAGANELVEVAKRAWKAAHGTLPLNFQLKAALIKAAEGKYVYTELLGRL